MSGKRYSQEFKIEVVKQITERNYPIGQVSKRLWVTTKSLYAWIKRERDIEIIKRSIKGGDNPYQATRNLGIFIFSNWLGLRSKELAALKVKDVYENGKVKDTLRLLAGYTKGEKHRDLALANPEVIKAIQITVVAQEEQYPLKLIQLHIPVKLNTYSGSRWTLISQRIL